MKSQRLNRIRQVLAKRQPDLTVLLEEVHKPHNVSAILRSCDAVGVLEVHAVVPKGGLPTYNATSGSAEKWISIQKHSATLPAISELQQRGFQVLATHLSERAVDYRELDYTRPTAFLLGAEKWGVSAEASCQADANIVIPMLGMVQSLNVSVAAAILLFEAQRQRLSKGFYEEGRLSRETLDTLTFEWLYPDLAKVYTERQQAYPSLNEHGDIV
ncbi:MAG: tRNA (guanosine(18)-2'-O)-methyltransferase TrmH [Deinococcaceae bacterium]